MRKLLVVLFLAGTAMLLVFAASSASVQQSSYAEDRALIEDLQARYMFALDNGDVPTYLSTFTKDGVLDIGDGPIKGQDERGFGWIAAQQLVLDLSPPLWRHRGR